MSAKLYALSGVEMAHEWTGPVTSKIKSLQTWYHTTNLHLYVYLIWVLMEAKLISKQIIYRKTFYIYSHNGMTSDDWLLIPSCDSYATFNNH